jgi:hypothetical protein
MCLRFVFLLITRLDWADRALLATLLAVIPKARRHGLRLLVTPDTILRWHRDIVRRRWAARSIRGKTGRPATRRNIRALVLRLARENPGWGYYTAVFDAVLADGNPSQKQETPRALALRVPHAIGPHDRLFCTSGQTFL